jgi:hypothetical protein
MDIADAWEEQDVSAQDDAPQEASKRPLLMKFCPHDSSMLYPKVCSNLFKDYLGFISPGASSFQKFSL